MKTLARWLVALLGAAAVLIVPAPANAATTLVYATFKGDAQADEELWLYAGLTAGWINRGRLWSSGYEGPSLVRLDDGSWRIYVDRYSTGGGIYTATSTDVNTWTGLTPVGCSGCRHGTAIPR